MSLDFHKVLQNSYATKDKQKNAFVVKVIQEK
jgi:hypothetical protein